MRKFQAARPSYTHAQGRGILGRATNIRPKVEITTSKLPSQNLRLSAPAHRRHCQERLLLLALLALRWETAGI